MLVFVVCLLVSVFVVYVHASDCAFAYSLACLFAVLFVCLVAPLSVVLFASLLVLFVCVAGSLID